jgi:hypothetical protein
MTRTEAIARIIGSTDITVEFKKRSNGELRVMRCSTDVSKHVKGGAASYDAKKKDLLVVVDLVKNEIRSIPTDRLTRILVEGLWIDVEKDA